MLVLCIWCIMVDYLSLVCAHWSVMPPSVLTGMVLSALFSHMYIMDVCTLVNRLSREH